MATPSAIYMRVHGLGGDFVSLTETLGQSSQYAAQIAPERISLEYRLRNAAHLQDATNSLLTGLERTLRRVRGEEAPWEALQDSDHDSDSASNASSDTGEDTELKQLIASIKSSVTCLFRPSMTIRNPVSDDRLQRTITVDKSYYEEHDILHTRAKYPDCADYLTERLGRAISARRQYLSYRELHHQKLAKDVDLIGLEHTRTECTSNSTEATPPTYSSDRKL
ncbi:hypothetical protein P171DRAFT_522225 [Karstenula rhodostoma CBS 690.94]|uniref:Uncharacterized protein n=1 Tax=Karstenula rhodostoma CBS 690.94 TaxID=1392251 RepID=A0A9P4PIY6_9PLEO|nr:hypothetical protein P171DRAFT_522225 [Karstenula rhodostoma CBS 690.94]